VIDTLYRLAKPVLFHADPESTHDLVISGLGAASRSSRALQALALGAQPPDPRLAVAIGELRLPGPVGIAAGLDKNGVAFPALLALGWDFVEVGTITPNPQPGNPKPRVFRLIEDEALINRMGFPGSGADAIAANLVARLPATGPVGCNLGPNRASVEAGLEAVISDCRVLAARFAPLADYLVVNVSSPNTARLRELQGKHALDALLREIQQAIPPNVQIPLFVKIAPDLSDAEIADVVGVALDVGLSGIVATNTTVGRPESLRGRARAEPGGLSGRPLLPRTLEVVRRISQESGRRLPIIAVGGITSSADVIAAIRAGASAVQVYTGMIFRGPGLARSIKRDLVDELTRTDAAFIGELRATAT
jgi:dihydroorotate dehydrogenase